MVDDKNCSSSDQRCPILLHCRLLLDITSGSAGIGRTGTFCVVHSLLEKIREDLRCRVGSRCLLTTQRVPTVSVVGSILRLRQQRRGIVQTPEQVEFCYLAIEEAIERYEFKW